MSQVNGDELFDFEKLQVYQLALEFLDGVFDVCRALPREMRFPLADQLIRAALSISNNIAEGTGKRSKKEKARYYSISSDSARECISMLNVLRRQRLLQEPNYQSLRGAGRRITGMLYGLSQSIDRTPLTVHR